MLKRASGAASGAAQTCIQSDMVCQYTNCGSVMFIIKAGASILSRLGLIENPCVISEPVQTAQRMEDLLHVIVDRKIFSY